MSVDLAAVIALVESSGRDSAVRFEPLLFQSWVAPQINPARDAIMRSIRNIHNCTNVTARMIACTSWGRYQILGENIYSLCGCLRDIFSFVNDPGYQRTLFDIFLQRRKIAFTLDEIQADPAKRQQFIVTYNGPNAVSDYWQTLQGAIGTLAGSSAA